MAAERLESKPIFEDHTGRRCMAPGGPIVKVMGETFELPCVRPAEPGDHTPNHDDHYAAVYLEGETIWYGWKL